VTRPLVILGTGVGAEEIADIAAVSSDYELDAFAENEDRGRCEHPLLGREVVWVDDLAGMADSHEAVCGIGTNRRRRFVDTVLELGLGFAVLRHPGAWVAPSATTGAGTVLGAGSVIAARAEIGEQVMLNRAATVGHHTTVGDYATISIGAHIAGLSAVGGRAFIGMGALVLGEITVGEGAVVGAGAVVTSDVAEGTQVQGVPARVVAEGVDGR
jgi:sugar O-acyltransferase (sialic acid O-acetyltransferase NeuD family)